ncbi:quinoprotein dehydrogenase-associated SoxYZ-like carrier [Maritimibacter sp. 55A14]|uniref:quinoprotein dehydrogenase-associated SoxYZ-like carrier n=1 Tax=Maritimibacter sp. 55A14 TaxID=2174844 RepID=UPI000D61C163|nr:quinoprotein dehydrogenase-associated SoxYZ-like carrier [Maritimibacter sp. 55A14]PWE31286.1 quinoprotein dehydrogenase-associated SoxYZ-like carrier [Maritimibacter sp. 55A14]
MRLPLSLLGALFIGLAGPGTAEEPSNPLTDSETWRDLRYGILGDVIPQEGGAIFAVDAPYRTHDAATVPVVIRQTDMTPGPIGKITLVVDENPAPMAAEIRFGPGMAPLSFETRVRVNSYSNMRVIAETPVGSYMSGRFVKASGGCSAPATRDPEVALAEMGKMRLRHFDDEARSGARREAQLMIRHPNYSGLQRDQITQLFVPAHFIQSLEVWQGDEMLFTLAGGISISENPVFRFKYTDNGAPAIRVRAEDTEGNVFERELPKPGTS